MDKGETVKNLMASILVSFSFSASALFGGTVTQVCDRVWVARDYGLANSMMVELDQGVVIVDAMESIEAAEDVKTAFSSVVDFSKKPVKAIIYTHFHADHIFGAKAFSQDPALPVYAHKTTPEHIKNLLNITREAISVRSARQFGTLLSPDDYGESGAGIGPKLRLHHGEKIGFLDPNHFVDKKLEFELDGVRFILLHTPGETDDQITVWLPDLDVVMPGDNIYHAFPNIYAIRGTKNRSVLQWVNSLSIVENLNAKYLVPSHTEPVTGENKVRNLIRSYRDGMKAIHDQTIRLANKGLSREEIVEQVRLPDSVQQHPWLKELYGTVKNSVRSVFSYYFGWFGGKAVDLDPLSKKDEAHKMIHALGNGWDDVWTKAHQALLAKEYQWSLQLCEYLLLDSKNAPSQDAIVAVKSAKAQALDGMATKHVSWANKNYYRTEALEVRKPGVNDPGRENNLEYIDYASLESLFKYMSVRVSPDKLKGQDQVVGFFFQDRAQWITLSIRNGIIEPSFSGQPVNPDLEVVLTESAWKKLVAKKATLVSLVRTQEMTFPGRIDYIGVIKLGLFLKIFI